MAFGRCRKCREWNAGRRARPKRKGGASRIFRGAPCAPLAYRSWTTRLPAFRFLLLFVRHCERSEAIQSGRYVLDCFVASLLANDGSGHC